MTHYRMVGNGRSMYSFFSPTPSDTPAGWQARLQLEFTLDPATGRTVLTQRRHQGPLQVQRPFYPEVDGACHVYILHPPGGVVGGDGLELHVTVNAGAQALITTPSASRFYRSAGPVARQMQYLHVAVDAALEWLPQETILFDGAKAHSLTRVELAGDAHFLGWEIICLGRPAATETFTHGAFLQGFELWRDGLPLCLEKGRFNGSGLLPAACWGLAGQPVAATLLCTLQQADAVAAIRAAWGEPCSPELFAVTQLDGALLCRYLGPGTARARELFTRAWQILRPALLGKAPHLPRIWQT